MNQDEFWENVDVSTHSDGDPETKTDSANHFECDSFTDKLYVPNRSYKKYFKPVYIASGAAVVVFMIIIIIIIIATNTKSDPTEENEKASFLSGLIIRDNDSLWNYNVEDNNITLIQSTDNILGPFDSYRETVFWSEYNTSKIISKNTTYGNIDKIFENLRFKVQAMAVDYVTDKLYAIDKISGTAIVIDLLSKEYGILLSDLKQPLDILLDPAESLMFVLQPSDSILRANMDGTDLTEIVLSTNMSALTLDTKKKQLYWIMNSNTIMNTDYLGLVSSVVFSDHMNIVSLTVLGDQLFWLWPSSELHNATLWSCHLIYKTYLRNSYCRNPEVQLVGRIRNASHIKSISNLKDIAKSNPCIHRAVTCQHLCLLTSDKRAGRSCGCYVGWELHADPRSCQPTTEFLLYVIGNTVRGRTLNNDRASFTDTFLPIKLYTKSLNNKGTIDFDYDGNNDDFYFSDDTHIYKIKLKTPSNQTIVQSVPSTHYIEDLAFDWRSTNLYYSNCSKSAGHKHSLHVLNVRDSNKFDRILKNFTYRDNFGIKGCPYATVVDPSTGNVFFSAEEISYRSIYRTSLDGTRLSMTSKNIDYVHKYRLLAIDYEKAELYWIHFSGLETKVRHALYDGSYDSFARVSSVTNARSIYISHEWMFLSTEFSILRGNKTSLKDFIRIVPRVGSGLTESVSGMIVVNLTLQTTDTSKNPCKQNNGGCEQFCYSAPKKTCGCIDDQQVTESGHCT